MRSSVSSFAAAFTLTVGAAAVFAQWPAYPTGVPKTPDGKPDLTAPTPRTADGKPDFSGTWELMRGGGGAGRGRGAAQAKGAPPAAGGARAAGAVAQGGPGAPRVCAPQTPADGPPLATFQNIASNFPGCLPPLTPWALNVLTQRKSENSKDNPDAHCLPLGLMQLHMHPQPRKIIQTPGVIVILYEAQGGVRQIFTDGRPLPTNDPQPWWYGYSIGHWDGDTLVVETTGFRDDVWLDIDGSPLTNSGKMTERFRRLNYGTMQIDVTIEDPKSYTKPFTVRVNHRLMPDTDLIEFVCAENEKSDAHLVGK
ncbi:MAG TPA: hypothetical protein VGG72_23685 [Bryobacteraceae bacterium]|jgi:hypothetical protein